MSGLVRLVHVWSGYVRLGQVISGQSRLVQVMFSLAQVNSSYIR
jgi:hypothetical protein